LNSFHFSQQNTERKRETWSEGKQRNKNFLQQKKTQRERRGEMRRRKKKKRFGNAVSWNGKVFEERNKNKTKTLRDDMWLLWRGARTGGIYKRDSTFHFGFPSLVSPHSTLAFRFTALSLCEGKVLLSI
jgi:hypothetical protein